MERRSFLKGLGATLALPAIVPLPKAMGDLAMNDWVAIEYNPETQFITIQRVLEDWNHAIAETLRIPEKLIYQISPTEKITYGPDQQYVSIPVTFKYQLPETDQVRS